MASPDIKKLLVQPQPACFACGPDNPRGLKLRFTTAADLRVSASWVPDQYCEGLSGVVHGGLVSTVLDEAMAKAVVAAGILAMTCQLEVRFRRATPSGQPLLVSGWIAARDRRKVSAEATLTDGEGRELAHAHATFLTL